MKFTKEEISLCKQVAERHVKEIHYGVWVAKELKKTIEISLWILPIGLTEKQRKEGKWFPLWTISDCLEFLRERGTYLVFIGQEKNKGWCEVNAKKIIHRHGGKTPLEACLKAVLAVLEVPNG